MTLQTIIDKTYDHFWMKNLDEYFPSQIIYMVEHVKKIKGLPGLMVCFKKRGPSYVVSWIRPLSVINNPKEIFDQPALLLHLKPWLRKEEEVIL